MGKIIAVANQKGGVGKTTTTINLAAAIGEKDRKVLLVDLDSQSNATSGVGVDKNEVENSTYELLSGSASFDDCVVHTAFKNLDVLPSTPDLTAAEIELLEEEHRDSKLKDALEGIKDGYEFIIIDCPPSLNLLTVNALAAADSVLVPIQCEYYALEGLSQLLQTISLVKERLNSKLKIEGIVFTMYDPRVRLSGQVVANVKHNLNEKTFRTVIPRNVRLAEAPSHGKPVMYYTRFCSGTRAYRNLAKEIVAVYEAELSALEKERAALAEQAAKEDVSHETPAEEHLAAQPAEETKPVEPEDVEVSESNDAQAAEATTEPVEKVAENLEGTADKNAEDVKAIDTEDAVAAAEGADNNKEESTENEPKAEAETPAEEESASEKSEPSNSIPEEKTDESEPEAKSSEKSAEAEITGISEDVPRETVEATPETLTEETAEIVAENSVEATAKDMAENMEEIAEEVAAENTAEKIAEVTSNNKNKAYEDLIAKAEREINSGI